MTRRTSSGDRSTAPRTTGPHHIVGELSTPTYVFDGFGKVMGTLAPPGTRRVTEEHFHRGGRTHTIRSVLGASSVLVNNMVRGKQLQGKRCAYVWGTGRSVGEGLRWLVGFDPAGTPSPPGPAVAVGTRAPGATGDNDAFSGWIHVAHLRSLGRRLPAFRIDVTSGKAIENRAGRATHRTYKLRPYPELVAVTNNARGLHTSRQRASASRDLYDHYLLRDGRVINLQIGVGSGLSTDSVLYDPAIRFKAKRYRSKALHRFGSDAVAKRVRLYYVTAHLHGAYTGVRGWIYSELLDRA